MMEEIVMQDAVSLISSLGFPIAITVWLLITGKKTDKIIENNTSALGEIKGIMLNCSKK
jgi:hypothetical protein